MTFLDLCRALEEHCRSARVADVSHDFRTSLSLLQEVFGPPREMDGAQQAVAGLPQTAFYGAAAAMVAALAGVGATVGGKAPGEGPESLATGIPPAWRRPVARLVNGIGEIQSSAGKTVVRGAPFPHFRAFPALLSPDPLPPPPPPCADSLKTVGQVAGVLAGAGAGAAAAVKGNEKRQKAAAVELQNVLAAEGFDPANLTSAAVAEVGEKFGVKDMSETLGEELKGLYDAYIRAVLPPGEPMK